MFCFYPETGGLPLESVDRLFAGEDVGTDDIPASDGKFYRKLQWDMVGRSIAAVKHQKQIGHGEVDDEERLRKESVAKPAAEYLERTTRDREDSDATM